MVNSLKELVTWANTNAGILGLVVMIFIAIIPAILSLIKYLNLKNTELQFERFKIYHQLIRDMVQPEAKAEAMMLDRQIAIVFELRNFPDYFELTLRILQGLKRQWNTGHPQFKRLLDEMERTIKFVQKRVKKTQQED